MNGYDATRAPELDLIADCVHCGFCLPTCPTYVLWGEEMDSPRGRIVLMKEGHEEISAPMVEHLDRCLGCMACVTACPSGVQYDKLIEDARPQIERNFERPPLERAHRRLIFELFTRPGRLRALAPAAAVAGRLGLPRLARRPRIRRLAPRLAAMTAMTPETSVKRSLSRLPERFEARGERRGTVALLQGCVQRVFFGHVNEATARVLAAEGFEVHAPRLPRCCGALALHAGEDRGVAPAREGHDRGARGLRHRDRERGRMRFRDARLRARAPRRARLGRARGRLRRACARRLRVPRRGRAARRAPAGRDDGGLPRRLPPRPRAGRPRAAARAAPRHPGHLELVEPDEWQICCGSAGIYNLVQPEPAAELGERKARNLLDTGAEAVVAGNPGCALQITAHTERLGRPLPVLHPMELLARSIG